MHGQISERKLPACGECLADGPIANSSASKSHEKGGRKLSVGDCALFQAGNAPPFIGILRKFTQEKDTTKLGVNWLYRPADVKLAKGGPLEAAPNEIFYSFHKDEISAASLLHPCKVAFLRKGVELPPGVSSFVCRRVYDTANKCLWWLTDRDYTDEHQDEVDQLLERTKLEMQAAVQSGGPSPRALTGPTSSQQIKSSSEVVQNAVYSAPNKSKKRERTDQNLEPSKRERSGKPDDGEVSPLKRERNMKPEEIASITDKDGGLLNPVGVERLVQLMQQDRNDGARKAADVASRRSMLAGVVAATERDDCLNRFVQLGGLPMLDDWLQEAHKGKVGDGGSPKEGDKGVEELLLTLLKALDKLPVDLDALKTCSVGKSVNHLRSHKNLEIHKKARKLVEIWKKRVDAEMKLSGEVKSGSSHGIWSYKQNSPDMLHSHLLKTGGPTEVAVKSSGAFAGSAKPMPNGTGPSEGISKPVPVSAGKMSTILASSAPPTTKREENGSSKLTSGPAPVDPPHSVKEERSIGSLQSQSNGQTWGSGSQGKGTASSTWKEDVKNASMGGTPSSKPGGTSSRHPTLSTKGLLGTTLSGGSKEVLSGKPLVWSRSAVVTEKVATSSPGPSERVATEAGRDSSNSQHRLILRIPNPGRSPARATGGSFEQAPPGSRVLSPNMQERSTSMSLDSSDVKSRVQNGNLTSPEANSETKSGGVRNAPGGDDERDKCSTSVPSESLTDTEKRGEESMRMDSERNVKDSHEQNGSVTVDTGFVQRSGPPEGVVEPEGGRDNEMVAGAVGTTADGVGSEATAMEVDDLGISLLASVAASEIRRTGVAGTPRERIQQNETSVDQDRASRVSSDATSSQLKEASESQQSVKEGVGNKDEMEAKVRQDTVGSNLSKSREEESLDQSVDANVGIVSDIDSKTEAQEGGTMIGEGTSKDGERGAFTSQEAGRLLETSAVSGSVKEDRHMDEGHTVSAPLPTGSPVPYSKDSKPSIGCGPECSVGSQDGHSIGRSAMKEGMEDKKLQVQGKVMAELGHGYGSTSSELKGSLPVSSAEAELKQEDTKGCFDVGQSFGRRGMDTDGHQISDMSNGFPEEDVLEVARQVAKEVEQMERYGNSISVSSEKAAQEMKSPGFTDTREVNYSDASRELRWKPHTNFEKAKDDDNRKRSASTYSEETREVPERLDQSAARSSEAESDPSRCASSTGDRKVSVPEAVEAALDGAQELMRRAMDVRTIGRVPSFHSPQMLGLNSASSSLASVAPQQVVKAAPRNLTVGEPTTPEQATETAGPSDDVIGGSDVSERPDFDLNEGFSVEESRQEESTTSPVAPATVVLASTCVPATSSLLTAPIAIVTATKGGFVLPASPMRTKSELGWKGSAATSAFRPAEPRRTPERQPSAGESLAPEVSMSSAARKIRPPLDLNIDLNVVDDRTFDEASVMGTVTASVMSSQGSAVGMTIQVPMPSVSSLTFQSDYSNFGQPVHHHATRPVLDLNMLDESEESGTLLDLDSRAAEILVPLTRSNNSSSSQVPRRASVMRDFDLNDGPSVEDAVTDDHHQVLHPPASRNTGASTMPTVPGLRRGSDMVGASWFAANNPFKATIPDFSSTRIESPFSVAATAAAQSYLGAGAGAAPFNTDLYRASVALSSAPAMTFPSGSQTAYPYSGFPLASGFPFTSAANFSGSSASPYLDSGGAISFPIASSGTVTSHLGRPPYMVGTPDNNNNAVWSARPSLDLNAGPESVDGDGGREDVMSMRPSPMVGGQPSMEQMRSFRQVVSPTGPLGTPPPFKRKEPESGWELNRNGGFKQQAWR